MRRVEDYTAKLQTWLRDETPFFHVRYNDAEWNGMFRLLCADQHSTGGQSYVDSLCDCLLSSFDEIAAAVMSKSGGPILIGSNWDSGGMESSDRFVDNMRRFPGLAEADCWATGDVWYRTYEERSPVDDKGIMGLIQQIREEDRTVCLVCNDTIAPAKQWIDANVHVSIPSKDAWNDKDRIFDRCTEQPRDSVFVWCAGMSKIVSWLVKKEVPTTSHVDLGSLFNWSCGVVYGGWEKRGNSEPNCDYHYNYLVNTLDPFFKGTR